jgi:hypothetical protein
LNIDRGVRPTPETDRIEAYLQGIADSLGRNARRKVLWRIHFDPHPGIKSGFALPGVAVDLGWGPCKAHLTRRSPAYIVVRGKHT